MSYSNDKTQRRFADLFSCLHFVVVSHLSARDASDDPFASP